MILLASIIGNHRFVALVLGLFLLIMLWLGWRRMLGAPVIAFCDRRFGIRAARWPFWLRPEEKEGKDG